VQVTVADVQSRSRISCACKGYVPVEGRFVDAQFAEPEAGPLPACGSRRTTKPGSR
jgi:hypothetical protein